MSGAAQQLRHAKGLDPMITAAKSGLPVDISKVIQYIFSFVTERLQEDARASLCMLSVMSQEQPNL